MLVIVRLGSQLPTPGVDPTFIKEFFAQQTGDAFNIFLKRSPEARLQTFPIFALSITPYITSSIIMQLLTIAIPKLEEMQKEGEEGRKKIAAITRYVTVALALIESTAMAVGFGRQGLLEEYNFVSCAVVVCTLTAGSAFMMWIGERITENGVGNGISIVLLINIISRVPSDLYTLYEKFMSGKKLAQAGLAGLIILAVILAVVVFVVLLQSGERRIAVQYSEKKYREVKNIRRTVYTYSASCKHCRSNPGYLCIIFDADSDRHCPVPRKRKRNRHRKPDPCCNEFKQLV